MSRVDSLTHDRQRRASDPRASAWVSANAGSGKTYVLVQRVKRLLLEGADPSRILCLTFTKAAAANMSNRLLRDLGAWVVMEEGQLRAELAAIDGLADASSVRATRVDAARRVFARTLETPGGLKIQTIHGFCDGLLHQFPFEAGVAASFQVLDSVAGATLLADARKRVAAAAIRDPSAPLGRAFARLAAEVDLTAKDDILQAVLKRRDVLDQMLDGDPDGRTLDARLRGAFSVPPDVTEADILARVVDEAELRPEDWPAAITLIGSTAKNREVEVAKDLAAALTATGAARTIAYVGVFRKDDGSAYAPSWRFTKGLEKVAPDLHAILLREHARIDGLEHLRRAVAAVERSHALVLVAAHIARDMRAAKERRGLLDYDDLVSKAAALLTGEQAAWVRWKLDRGIDHILVDEAQDTSRAQWAVVRALSEEFFAGETARSGTRTLFAVGDDKQSIFSFQGAEPALFGVERQRVGRLADEAKRRFEDVRLTVSFRSVPAVLAAVDAVFAREEAASGVTFGNIFPPHESRRLGVPGRVEVWPVEAEAEKHDIPSWEQPFAPDEPESPRVRLAERLARQIKAAIGRDLVQDKDGARPLRAGDVLILVRSRNTLFEAILRALKSHGVPVAGADRLVLVEHIAVMDLMALGDVLLLPDDDLSLAAVLKSPLIGLDENELFDVAWKREGSLMAALRARAAGHPRYAAALARLDAWAPLARGARPYEFYARVLGADGGRLALQARLGREATDAIDEFLGHALSYEAGGIPTLHGFLAELREARSDIKREFDERRDEVRVMTAHAAKGLEAKLVVLPDTTTVQGPDKAGPIFDIGGEDAPLLVWGSGPKQDTGPLVAARAAAHERAMEESRRLLYVALTRAEERLIIAGAPPRSNNPSIPEASWYALVRAGLEPGGRLEMVDGIDGTTPEVLVSRESSVIATSDDAAVAAAPTSALADFAWIHRPPPPAQAPPRAITPARRRLGPETDAAATRGAALHRLLQLLPDIPVDRRATRALDIARRLAPEMADAIAVEALAVVDLPAFAPFLSADAIAEVPIAGALDDDTDAPVTGRIDRLVVGADTILLLDYKTGHAPAPGVVPPDTARQLALYADLLARTFPGRSVVAHVLWTGVPRLDVVAEGVLTAARESVMAAIP